MAARSTPKAAARGVFAVVGEDSFLAERHVASVVREQVGGDAACVERLRGDEVTWARVLDSARARSLFAPRRVVLVRGGDAIKGADDGLTAYLDDPNPDVALVFVLLKPDRRRSVWKLLLERAEVLSAEPLKGVKLRAFVADQVRQRGLALGEDGLAELLERVGQDLRRLMGEVDKLEAFAAGRPGRLGADEVAAVLGRGLSRPLYKLSDALWGRRTLEALELVQELLDDGEAGPRLLATLQRALRQLRGARALLGRRAPHEELARRLGVMPFKTRDLLESARRWADADLARALAALEQADRRLKTGIAEGPVLAAALVGACGSSSPPRPAP